MSSERVNKILRVFVIALIGNIFSAIIKMTFGLLANSVALLADAAHSIFDAMSSVIGIYGIKISAQPPDREHPYGHSRFEYVATLGIVVMLFVACFNILREAIDRAISNVIPKITIYSFVSISVSLAMSLFISIYERRVGKSTSSMILLADSSHTLTDVLASLVVIVGLFGTDSGFSYADPFAAILVCVLIAYVGWSMFKEATGELIDRGVTLDTLRKVRDTVEKFSRELGWPVDCHDVRGKVVGGKIYVDMNVIVEKNLTVEESHQITETIESKLKQVIEGIEEVIMHVEPLEDFCSREHRRLREKMKY